MARPRARFARSNVAPLLAAVLASALPACSASSASGEGSACSGTGRSTCSTGLECAAGFCRESCETSRDCDAGRRCLATTDGAFCSLPSEDSCRVGEGEDDPCGALVCARGECRTTCESAGDCGTGGACSDGTCVEPISSAQPDGSPCTTDEGCRTGSVCAGGRCRPACASEACDRGNRCLSFEGTLGCSLDDEDACTTSSTCSSDLQCAEGECRTRCDTSADCGPTGTCTDGTCDEPTSTGRADAGSSRDAGYYADDVPAFGFDTGPRGAQTQLANLVTASPDITSVVTILDPYLSPTFSARTDASRGPTVLTLAAADTSDGHGVGYVGAIDGTERAHLFQFAADAPGAATDVSSSVSDAAPIVGLTLAEDSFRVRGIFLRDRSDDLPDTSAGWLWTSDGGLSPYSRDLGTSYGVYTFGEAGIMGGTRSIGADQTLRIVVNERERIQTATEPFETYAAGEAYLSTLGVVANELARDGSFFAVDTPRVRSAPDFGLLWDSSARTSRMMRFSETSGSLVTSFDTLSFIGSSTSAPSLAGHPLFRTEAAIAVPNASSTTLHRITCPVSSACSQTSSAEVGTPSGGALIAQALATVENGYVLVTGDASGVILRPIGRTLSVIPGYDSGALLEPFTPSSIVEGSTTYALTDVQAYAIDHRTSGGSVQTVTVLVAGLFVGGSQARVWVGGLHITIPSAT